MLGGGGEIERTRRMLPLPPPYGPVVLCSNLNRYFTVRHIIWHIYECAKKRSHADHEMSS